MAEPDRNIVPVIQWEPLYLLCVMSELSTMLECGLGIRHHQCCMCRLLFRLHYCITWVNI